MNWVFSAYELHQAHCSHLVLQALWYWATHQRLAVSLKVERVELWKGGNATCKHSWRQSVAWFCSAEKPSTRGGICVTSWRAQRTPGQGHAAADIIVVQGEHGEVLEGFGTTPALRQRACKGGCWVQRAEGTLCTTKF